MCNSAKKILSGNTIQLMKKHSLHSSRTWAVIIRVTVFTKYVYLLFSIGKTHTNTHTQRKQTNKKPHKSFLLLFCFDIWELMLINLHRIYAAHNVYYLGQWNIKCKLRCQKIQWEDLVHKTIAGSFKCIHFYK